MTAVSRGAVLLLGLAIVAAGCLDWLDGVPATGDLTVYVVDVGQGDGTIWVLPDGSIIVYDCGVPADDAADNAVVQQLLRLGARPGERLHALISSHGHLDHIGGCDEIIDTFRFANLYEVWYEGDDAPRSYERFKDKIRDAVADGATLHTLDHVPEFPRAKRFAAGMDLALPAAARDNGTWAEILWPPAGDEVTRWSNIAESSIVIRLGHGATMCFQGDIEVAQERAILDATPGGVSCDVHLVGHHGSRHANSPDWLLAMQPTIAVVSHGENSYGHPTDEAMCQHTAVGAALYSTHESGTIAIRLGDPLHIDASAITWTC